MFPDLDNFSSEEKEDKRSAQEKALHKATAKSPLSRKDEEEILRKLPKMDAIDIGLDREDEQKQAIALAIQEATNIKNAELTNELHSRLNSMEESFTETLRLYSANSYKKEGLTQMIDDKTKELNEMYNDLHTVLTLPVPKEEIKKKNFFRQQKEMILQVGKTGAKLEKEILRAQAHIEMLEDKLLMTKAEVKEATLALKKIQEILRPGKNLYNN